ncbi:unnamed protein product [Sphagnum balticum]
MGAIAGGPDPLTSDAARSGSWRLQESPGCVRACMRTPDSTLVLTSLLEGERRDGARRGRRGTMSWLATTAEFSFAWKDGLGSRDPSWVQGEKWKPGRCFSCTALSLDLAGMGNDSMAVVSGRYEQHGPDGRNHDPTNRGDEADDSLPSIEEILGPLLRKEIATTGCQGTRDRPVILEDDERDTPDPTADSEATSASANAGPVLAFELSKRADPAGREAWWDVEDACFVYEDLHPLPPLVHEGLASTPAQDQPHSRRHAFGLSQDQTKPTWRC